MQRREHLTVFRVELDHLGPNGTPLWKVIDLGIRSHRMDRGPVDDEALAARSGARRVAAHVGATLQYLTEAEIVRDFLSFRMKHVTIAVPHLTMLQPLSLLLDLIDRRERRLEIVHGDHPAFANETKHLGRDLATGITREHGVVTHRRAQVLE